MRHITLHPELITNAQEYTINGMPFKVAIFLEKKKDKNKIMVLNWNNIDQLTYIDDIATVGLTGTIILTNYGNLFTDALNNTSDYFIGLYIQNTINGYEENIYFSIISSEIMPNQSTTGSTKYRLELVESFIFEGANKNFMAMSMTDNGNSSLVSLIGNNISAFFGMSGRTADDYVADVSLPSLIRTTRDFICSELVTDNMKSGTDFTLGGTTSLQVSKDEELSRIIDIDEGALNHFETSYDTKITGTVITENTDHQDSCSSLLENIHKNCYFPAVDTNWGNISGADEKTLGEVGSVRSENTAGIAGPKNLESNYSFSFNKGERKLIIRNLRDIFTDCFVNKHVYEIYVGDKRPIMNGITASFMGTSSFESLQLLPLNVPLINNEWCDYIVSPVNTDDSVDATYYKFIDLINTYNMDYLGNAYTFNILPQNNSSNGITRKVPPLNDDRLNYAASARTIRNMVLLNSLLMIKVPGGLHRKANEIIYIDSSMTAHSDKAINTAFSDMITDNFFYVTRVKHSFGGTIYTNEMSVVSVCSQK